MVRGGCIPATGHWVRHNLLRILQGCASCIHRWVHRLLRSFRISLHRHVVLNDTIGVVWGGGRWRLGRGLGGGSGVGSGVTSRAFLMSASSNGDVAFCLHLLSLASCRSRSGVYGFWQAKFNFGIAPESLLKADLHGCLGPRSFSRGCIICCCCALGGGWGWGGKGNRVPMFSLLRAVQYDGGGGLTP